MKEPAGHDILTGLMSKEETARALKRSTRTLDRYHTDRIGPPRFFVGGKVVYDRRDVCAWVKQQKEKTSFR